MTALNGKCNFFYKKYCVVVIPLHSITHRDVVFVSWSYVRARCGLVSHLGRCCLLTASPLFSLLAVTLLSFCQFLISFAVTFQRFCRFFIFSSAMCYVAFPFFPISSYVLRVTARFCCFIFGQIAVI